MNWEAGNFRQAGFALDPIKAIVGPRPIGWISTLSADGVANLAPYSFFNIFATEPYYVAFGSEGKKDTLTNIEATGEFVVNFASRELAEAMNVSSTSARGDEFALAGLAKASCMAVKAPRVAAAPASLECRHFQTVPLPGDDGSLENFLVIGRVVHVHVADGFVKNARVDTAAMQLIARHGYADYSTVESVWQMRRPG